jgi:IMP cyclohydrolase
MNISRESFEPEVQQHNLAELAANPYPGRGIVVGETAAGTLMQVYWIMGRSEGSQNRVFEQIRRNVHTKVFDESKEKGDPALTIYNAMGDYSGFHAVSNGYQTEHILDGVSSNPHTSDSHNFATTLLGHEHEPDAPNYTPRISAYSSIRHPGVAPYSEHGFSVIRRDQLTDTSVHEFTRKVTLLDAAGLCIHTYMGDGNPLPAFDQSPYPVPVGETAQESAELYWENLNPDNRVAVAAKEVDSETGEIKIHIINRHKTAG